MALLNGLIEVPPLAGESRLGLYVREVGSGQELVDFAGSAPFPAASVVKLFVVAEAFVRAEEGLLRLGDMLPIQKFRDTVGGSGVLKFTSQTHESILKLLDLAITVSDNVAANVLIDHFGMDAVNDRVAQLGLHSTVLRRLKMDREARERGLENETSPRDCVSFLMDLYGGELLNRSHTALFLDLLRRQTLRDRLPRYLPPELSVLHKTGSLIGVEADVGLVFGPDTGPGYAIAAFVTGFERRRAAREVIAELSFSVYRLVSALHGGFLLRI